MPNDRSVPVEIETSVETKVDAINVTVVADDRIEDNAGTKSENHANLCKISDSRFHAISTKYMYIKNILTVFY